MCLLLKCVVLLGSVKISAGDLKFVHFSRLSMGDQSTERPFCMRESTEPVDCPWVSHDLLGQSTDHHGQSTEWARNSVRELPEWKRTK